MKKTGGGGRTRGRVGEEDQGSGSARDGMYCNTVSSIFE
jgi:hypothetical protein